MDNKLTLKENINKNDGSSNNNINNSIKNDEKKIRIDLMENNTQKINAFIVINNPNYLINSKNNSNNIEQTIKGADIKYYEFINNDSAKIKEIPLQNIDNKSLNDLTYLTKKIKKYDEMRENEEKMDELDKEIEKSLQNIDNKSSNDLTYLTKKIEEYNEIRDNNNKVKKEELDEEIKPKIGIIAYYPFKLSYNSKENKQSTTKKLNFHSISYSELDNDNLKQGKGIIYYNNKEKYEGEFKNNKREGKGIYYFNNGNRYEGNWENNFEKGKGIFYYDNGDIEIREYNSGCSATLILHYFENEDKICKCSRDEKGITDSNILNKNNVEYKDDYYKLKKIIQREKDKKKQQEIEEEEIQQENERKLKLRLEVESKIEYISGYDNTSGHNDYKILFNKLFDTNSRLQYVYEKIPNAKVDTYKIVFLDDNNNNKNLYLQFNNSRKTSTSFYIGTMSDETKSVFNARLVFDENGDCIVGEDSNIDDTQFKGFIINKNSNYRNNNKQVIYVGSNESWQIHKTWGNKDDFFNLLEEMDTPVCCRSPLKKLYIKRFNEHIDLVKGIKDKDQQITLNK